MEDSLFRETIDFLGRAGLYDVILPFLLVFTVVFAILEKTKIFGIGKYAHKEGDDALTTKKNLNATFSFIAAFMVVASTQLVAVINEVIAHVALVLILCVCFLMLVGTFHHDKEFKFHKKYPGWMAFFVIVAFITIVAIFLNALGWLDWLIDYAETVDGEWISGLVFLLITIGIVGFIIQEPKPKKEDDSSD